MVAPVKGTARRRTRRWGHAAVAGVLGRPGPRLRAGIAPDAVARRAGAVLLALALLVGCSAADEGPAAGPTDVPTSAAGEAVTIPAEGIELVGTLRLPDGEPPFPGVTIAHGSGPQSRRGLAPGQLGLTFPEPVAVHEQLATGLVDAGFAVLTWDKRSCGPFNGCADNGYPTPTGDLTFDTFVDDVGAVLDHLGAREDIGSLALIGHSKGGTVAAQLAAERADLEAVVLLAASPLPIDEVLATQADTLAELVEAAGQQGTAADQAVADVRELAEQVAAIADGAVTGDPVGGASRAFWASWIEASRQAPSEVARAEVPILALGGGRDWNVPPEQVEAWEPHLGERSRVEILPDITHALTRLASGDPSAITPADVGTEVDDAAITAIADWLAR